MSQIQTRCEGTKMSSLYHLVPLLSSIVLGRTASILYLVSTLCPIKTVNFLDEVVRRI